MSNVVKYDFVRREPLPPSLSPPSVPQVTEQPKRRIDWVNLATWGPYYTFLAGVFVTGLWESGFLPVATLLVYTWFLTDPGSCLIAALMLVLAWQKFRSWKRGLLTSTRSHQRPFLVHSQDHGPPDDHRPAA